MVVVAAVISISWKQQWKYPLVSGWLGWQPVMLAEHTVLLGSNWSSCVLVVPVLWYGLVLPLTVPPFLFSLTSGSSAFPLIKKTSFFFPKKYHGDFVWSNDTFSLKFSLSTNLKHVCHSLKWYCLFPPNAKIYMETLKPLHSPQL